MNVDGYIRVSRVGGRAGDGYISPDIQRERIQAYATELGATISEWHTDEDYSGGNIDRPGFQRALARIEAGETGGIVVMAIDRFARTTGEGATCVRDILNAGAIFASCQERIDPKTPTGQYMLNAFLNNAELQLNTLKASWVVAKERAVARGAHIGPTPFGYLRVQKGEDRSGTLYPHPDQAPAVLHMFEGRHAGATYTDLARRLQAECPRQPPFTVVDVKRMLGQRVYLGEVHHGQQTNLQAHEPIVPIDLFDVVQSTRLRGRQLKADSPFLLSGLIRCAHCRYAMGGASQGGANRTTPTYRCIGRTRGCEHRPLITAAPVEELVLRAFWARVHDVNVAVVSDTHADLLEHDAAVEAAEAEVALWTDLDSSTRAMLDDGEWERGLQARLTVRLQARSAREFAYRSAGVNAAAKKVTPEDTAGAELRVALGGVVQHVFIRKAPRGATVEDRVMIVWADEETIDTPTNGGSRRSRESFGPVAWKDHDPAARVHLTKVIC